MRASLTPWLTKYVAQYAIPHGGYLFHARRNEFEPLSPSGWTKRVKGIFERHGDVALCPKDTRIALSGPGFILISISPQDLRFRYHSLLLAYSDSWGRLLLCCWALLD